MRGLFGPGKAPAGILATSLARMAKRSSRALRHHLSGDCRFVTHAEKIPQTGLTGKEFVLISFYNLGERNPCPVADSTMTFPKANSR